jgi:hypothetical protein
MGSEKGTFDGEKVKPAIARLRFEIKKTLTCRTDTRRKKLVQCKHFNKNKNSYLTLTHH